MAPHRAVNIIANEKQPSGTTKCSKDTHAKDWIQTTSVEIEATKPPAMQTFDMERMSGLKVWLALSARKKAR